MKLRKALLTAATLAVATLALAGPARGASLSASDAQGLVDDARLNLCEPVPGDRFVCLDGLGYTQGGSPVVSACAYSDLIFGQYGNKIACVTTHHWAYLGTPGACVSLPGLNDPAACAGYDRTDPQTGRTKHCVFWVTGGTSLCRY